MTVSSIRQAIMSPKMRVFRRAYIKRRLTTSGGFEDDWLEVTSDVKRWGTIRMKADTDRPGKFTIDGIRLTMHNDSGRYNPNDNENSLWFNYLPQQRTLIKLEAGYVHESLGSNAIWSRSEFPSNSYWDEEEWDNGLFDSTSQLFTGIISGEISLSDQNEVVVQAKPLVQVFRDFPAANLSGLNSSVTASGFIQILRDQTDGAGSFVFRPFFGGTTTYWDISATSNVYSQLNTTTAKDVRDKTCWDIIEKLAEAENFSAYVDQRGTFHFTPKSAGSSVAFEFHGLGSFDSDYGHTIKGITRFGKDTSRFYSRVQVRFGEADTSTSFVSAETSFAVDPNNAAWGYGHKTFSVENYWIPSSAVAQTIADAIYDELAEVKDVIEFKTTFIPHLDLLNRVSLHYDSTTRARSESLWDANDWDTELTWDISSGDAITLDGEEFKFLSIELDLDNFESKFIARRV